MLSGSSLIAQTAGENIDVTHYEIHIGDFDFTNRTLQGETFVDFTASASVQQVVLELKYLAVSTVTATGATVSEFSQSGDFLTINLASPLAAGSTATLDIVYGGNTFSESWGGVEWWGQYVYNLGVGFDSQPHNLGKTSPASTTSPTRPHTMSLSPRPTTRKPSAAAIMLRPLTTAMVPPPGIGIRRRRLPPIISLSSSAI